MAHCPEPDPAPVTLDPVESAKIAGLRYVSDQMPGIRRRRAGKGWTYIGVDGKPIRDRNEIARINKLAIPPAYTDVWICPNPRGHLQATGRDAKGRKQYRYHPRWREVRDETKYDRMMAFADALPRIRAQVDRDLARPGLPREKVLATVVELLDLGRIRIGNEEYAQQNESYGLTTMRDEHVDVQGSTIKFRFRGKSGKQHEVDVKDRRLANVVRRCQDLGGEELFTYSDGDDQPHPINSDDVNEYLQEISGNDFTAKDFRTWTGTVRASKALRDLGPPESEREAKRKINEAVKDVSQYLGNTPAICRKCYVHPRVIEAFIDGNLMPPAEEAKKAVEKDEDQALRDDEMSVLTLLRDEAAREAGEQRRGAA
jgi:DNA topoisomerase-1